MKKVKIYLFLVLHLIRICFATISDIPKSSCQVVSLTAGQESGPRNYKPSLNIIQGGCQNVNISGVYAQGECFGSPQTAQPNFGCADETSTVSNTTDSCRTAFRSGQGQLLGNTGSIQETRDFCNISSRAVLLFVSNQDCDRDVTLNIDVDDGEGDVYYNDDTKRDLGVRQRSNFSQLFTLGGTPINKNDDNRLKTQPVSNYSNDDQSTYQNGTNNNTNTNNKLYSGSALSSDHRSLAQTPGQDEQAYQQQHHYDPDHQQQDVDRDTQALELIYQQKREREQDNGNTNNHKNNNSQGTNYRSYNQINRYNSNNKHRGSFQQVYDNMNRSVSGLMQLNPDLENNQEVNNKSGDSLSFSYGNVSQLQNSSRNSNKSSGRKSKQDQNLEIQHPPGNKQNGDSKVNNQKSDTNENLLKGPSRVKSINYNNISQQSSLGNNHQDMQPQDSTRHKTPSDQQGSYDEPWVQEGLGINVQRQVSNSSYNPQSQHSESPINTNAYRKIIKQAEVHPYMLQTSITRQQSQSPYQQSNMSQSPVFGQSQSQSPTHSPMNQSPVNNRSYQNQNSWRQNNRPQMELSFSPVDRSQSKSLKQGENQNFNQRQDWNGHDRYNQDRSRNRSKSPISPSQKGKKSSPRQTFNRNRNQLNTGSTKDHSRDDSQSLQSASLKNVDVSQGNKFDNTRDRLNQLKSGEEGSYNDLSVGRSWNSNNKNNKARPNSSPNEKLSSNQQSLFSNQQPSVPGSDHMGSTTSSARDLPQMLSGLDSLKNSGNNYQDQFYQNQDQDGRLDVPTSNDENIYYDSSHRNSQNSRSKNAGSDISLHNYRNNNDDSRYEDSYNYNEPLSLRNSNNYSNIHYPPNQFSQENSGQKNSQSSVGFNFQNKNSQSINSTVDTPQISPRAKEARRRRFN